MYDVVIIGSGPAGLSASIYAKRAGLKAVTLERNPMSGGQVLNTYEVDNYPGLPGISGFELGQKFRTHADQLGAEFVNEQVQELKDLGEKKLVVTEKSSYETRTLILATGARHRKLNVPGEKELAGVGVSYCATCDGAFFRGKTVAVVGGGDVALEDALFLARGCEKVYLIHRREEFRGARILQERVRESDNIELVLNSNVIEILGEQMVTSVLVHNHVKNERHELQVQGVFIAVGISPNVAAADGLVEQDQQGYIKAGEDAVTSVPGIFAAGDVRTKQLRQVITAASDGANAVISAERYLSGN